MDYDIIIIGAGPAGLTAGIYGIMANKKTLIIEKSYVGGQLAIINKIKNYPGFEEIDGYDLAQKMKKQAVSLGVKFITEEVNSVNLNSDVKIVKTHFNEYKAKAVIIATGAYAKPLEVSNEKQFLGKGLSYCSTCDGHFFKDKVVAVVGGGNKAIEDCLYLSNLAKKVYLIHRRDFFKANENSLNIVKNLALNDNKIEILTNCIVTKLIGNDSLKQIEILNKVTNIPSILNVDGIFVAIGRKPDADIFSDTLKLSDGGFIITDEHMRTSIKNVYAVGDVRESPLRQIITACADGAIAAMDCVAKLNNN